ncbi:MAG: family transposase [Firmicutes bacterium]|nr:family transposase [Bacillota bacterium]
MLTSLEEKGVTASSVRSVSGGFSTKIHLSVDVLGNPLQFLLAGGQFSDISAKELILHMGVKQKMVLSKEYDSDLLVETILTTRGQAVIPWRSSRKHPPKDRKCGWYLYKEHLLVANELY